MDIDNHFQGNAEENEAQVEFSASQSIRALMQQSMIRFEHEISVLENSFVLKTKQFKELKVNCTRQVMNIAEQTLDLEHLKIKIEHEEINRDTRYEKIHDFRDNCKKMEQYFSSWVMGINLMMLPIEELKQMINRIKIYNNHAKTNFITNNKECQQSLNQVKEAIKALNSLVEVEGREFNDLQNHFNGEIKVDKETNFEKQIQLQELEVESLKKITMNKILNSTNLDLKNTYEALNKVKQSELEIFMTTILKLDSSLKVEIDKSDQLNSKIQEIDSLLKKGDIFIEDMEVDITNLNTKQKKLVSKEEEHKETLKKVINAVYELSMNAKQLKKQFSENLIVNEDNSNLKQKYNRLVETNENKCKQITELEKKEQTYDKGLQLLIQRIICIQNNINSTISKILLIKQQIDNFIKQQNDDINEHARISLGIDEYFNSLVEDQDVLKSKIIYLNQSICDASNVTHAFSNTIHELKVEHNELYAILEEIERKMQVQVEECGMVTKDILENIHCLNGMILRAKEEYLEAQCNIHLSLNLKGQIDYLYSELQQHQNTYKLANEELKETNALKIESKNLEMEDSRTKYERLFRNKEQNKTDALVELKENKIKISDFLRQEDNLSSEIKRMEKKLVKCDNLVLSLEKKLKVVAHVATEVSQTVTDTPSQNNSPVKPTKEIYSIIDDWGFGC